MGSPALRAAADSAQPFTRNECLFYCGSLAVIGIALATINTLGALGIFPGSHGALIVGCSNLGLVTLGTLTQIKLELKNQDMFNKGINLKALKLFNVMTALVLNILAMQGTLSLQMVGMGMLLSSSLSLATSSSIIKLRSNTMSLWSASDTESLIAQQRHSHLKKDLVLYLIPIAIAVISCLGITGVIGGGHASLILGMTALGGSATYILGKYLLHHPNRVPPIIQRQFLIHSVYGIGMAILALYGSSPLVIGFVGLAGAHTVFLHDEVTCRYIKAEGFIIPTPAQSASPRSNDHQSYPDDWRDAVHDDPQGQVDDRPEPALPQDNVHGNGSGSFAHDEDQRRQDGLLDTAHAAVDAALHADSDHDGSGRPYDSDYDD